MLDYFGSTVNMASRVQGLSDGGDVVITEAVARDVAVAALLEQERPAVEELNVELKGMGCCFALRRLRVNAK
jgi:class 3 adenylate cyclase